MGHTTGPEFASGDIFRASSWVRQNFLACLVTPCWTSTDRAPIGVSLDCKDIHEDAPCHAACAVGFESANHTELSWKGNSAPPSLRGKDVR